MSGTPSDACPHYAFETRSGIGCAAALGTEPTRAALVRSGAVVLIDAHTHVFGVSQVNERAELCARDPGFAELYGDPGARLATVGTLVTALDRAGIDRAVAAGFAFANERDLDCQSDAILGGAADARGRIVPVVGVNPALPGWKRQAERALRDGARGFGELRPGTQGWNPLGEAAWALCELASERGAVLLWHVSEPVGHRYPGKKGGIAPADLWQVAVAFPGLRMIAAHMGGGLSFYLQMPEVRAALEKVYFDTAAWPLLYDDASITRLVDLAGAKRVLFGSDYPLLLPRREVQRISALLPAEIAQAVCGGNADILFSELHDK